MEIRLLKINEIDKLLDAIKRLWNPNHVYCRNPELLKYLIYNTPYRKDYCGNDENTSCYVVIDDNKVVGFEGLIPLEGNIFGESVSASTATLLKMDKNYKLAGIDLIETVYKNDPSIHVSIGTNTRALKLFSALGRYTFKDFPRWVWTNKFDELKKIFKIDNNSILNCLNWNISSNNILPKGSYDSFIEEEKWNKFYNMSFAKRTIGIKRDYKFLKWRYIDYPFFNYKIILLKDVEGNYKGLAVYRIESILDGKYKIGRILEFIYDDIDYGMNLCSKLQNEEDILFWDFYCLSSITATALEYCGFIRLDRNESNKMIPTRFQPIDFNVMNIMGAIRLSEDAKHKVNLVIDQQWYVTRGDADQDRPN